MAYIKYDEKIPVKENLMAIADLLNKVCSEMYVGRVPKNKEATNIRFAEMKGEISPIFAAAKFMADDFTDEQAMQVPVLYDEWQEGVTYAEKKRITYGTNSVGDPQLYMVLQEHTSAAEHTPGQAVSLYKAIGLTEDGIPEWAQPYGATDAYNAGDVVSHDGKTWVSNVDANVWEPGVYGWTEVTEG